MRRRHGEAPCCSGVAASPVLWIPAAAGAGYLTWKWFLFRAKNGIRF